MKKTILGLDIGINSIGWALIKEDSQIIDCGVRIFPVGVKEDDYNKSGSEISKNASRRLARSIRRGYFRYKLRRKALLSILQELKMLPENGLIHLPSKELYALRRKGLDEKLSLQEFGRIILLLNQRRGFKSSKKGLANEKEKSQLKLEMKELEKKIIEQNCRTIGEYFYLLFLKNSDDENCYNSQQPVERIRTKHVDRKLYAQEFDLIWEKQKKYYPEILTDENKKRIKDDCLYYQRKLKSQKHLVGKCQFESTKKCCPASKVEFQEFRIWQILNNIRITVTERYREPLTTEEKNIIFDKLNTVEHCSISEIKKAIGLSSARFNELPEKLKGNTTHARIANAIGFDFYWSLSPQQQQQLWHILFFADDEDWLYNYAVEKLNFTDKQAAAFAAVQLEDGYSSISSKALLIGKDRDVVDNGILHNLKKGSTYDMAVKEAGYSHHSYDAESNDPNRILVEKITLDTKENIRNPLVQQCISESIRLVNAIIKKYGPPDIIRVEMARSLKKPKNEREQEKRRNDDTAKRRDEYREFLKKRLQKEYITKSELIKFELFLEMQYAEDELKKVNEDIDTEEFKKFSRNVKTSDREKYALWLECGRISPYTGNVINLTRLFSSEIEIEHIIPYSKCMNDSFNNKTLCERHINEEKGNRTPYEYLGNDTEKWKEFKERIRYFKDNKQEQFTRTELPDDFLSSQLNNTAYVAREVQKHLKKVCKEVNITNGQATSWLRKFWGLNELLNPDGTNEKSRHDHRHHIIDAIVIAFTSIQYIQILSRESQFDGSGRMRVEGIKFPFPSFKLQVNEKLNDVLVSYRNKKRLLNVKTNKYIHSDSDRLHHQKTFQVRGALHEETHYGIIKNPRTGESNYVVRKPVNTIDTEKQIDKIVDPQIQNIIRDHIVANGGKIKPALVNPVYMKTKTGKNVPIKNVRMLDNSERLIQLRPKENSKLFVSSGSNYCIAIYENESGERDFETVSFFDAVKRKKASQHLMPFTKNGKKLIFSLKQKDMVILYDKHPDEVDWNDKRDLHKRLCRVIKFDVVGQVFFGRHNISKLDKTVDRNINLFQQKYSTMKAIKVQIDILGNIKKV
ncbi:MAG: hypothetical protein JST82_14045 [Bacteroidetes bacterium]|nr:hypothetical protein [Bacteroidota bacterium]